MYFKDINFQEGFLLVAVVILVMVILNVAYKLNKEDDKVNPIVAPCPDYWDLSGAYCINTNGQNIGHESGEYSIWNNVVTCQNDYRSKYQPYNSIEPIHCDNGLRTIPVGSMYLLQKKKIVGGGGIGDNYKKNQRKRTKASRKKWANKYGFVWDGLNTKW
jgi:hypothetical protein